jgi:EPS-associated MarR family transcriptional regulator
MASAGSDKKSSRPCHSGTLKLRGSQRVAESRIHYMLMRLLEINPRVSQRELARELGVSLGKANACLQLLIREGCVKAEPLDDARARAGCRYVLTSNGIARKASLTVTFLDAKIREYELLRAEIRQMRREVRKNPRVSLAAESGQRRRSEHRSVDERLGKRSTQRKGNGELSG